MALADKAKIIKISQGHRKQFFSGQANELQSCAYRDCRVMRDHKFKLLYEPQ